MNEVLIFGIGLIVTIGFIEFIQNNKRKKIKMNSKNYYEYEMGRNMKSYDTEKAKSSFHSDVMGKKSF